MAFATSLFIFATPYFPTLKLILPDAMPLMM